MLFGKIYFNSMRVGQALYVKIYFKSMCVVHALYAKTCFLTDVCSVCVVC